MNSLLSRPARRLFTFGCSFTNYMWPTWANIVASELAIPFWNYGEGGAGKQYIFNMIMQADALHKFTEDDAIMICWSSVTREDRCINGEWQLYGNIFNNPVTAVDGKSRWANTPWVRAQKFLAGWGDPDGFLVRDLAFVKAAVELINVRGCQLTQLSMMGFELEDSQGETIPINDMLEMTYSTYTKQIKPSFYQVLWDNDLGNKQRINQIRAGKQYRDMHPWPSEHMNYIEQVLDYQFSDRVRQDVEDAQQIIDDKITGKIQADVAFPKTFPQGLSRRGIYKSAEI